LPRASERRHSPHAARDGRHLARDDGGRRRSFRERVGARARARLGGFVAAKYIDLNCDMGESYGRWTLGADEEIMPHITSANVACGFHGGDPHVMRKTVALALKHGVAVGAHPSLPDLMGFGRRVMDVSPQELKDYICYQMGALREYLRAAGTDLQHMKPHGIF